MDATVQFTSPRAIEIPLSQSVIFKTPHGLQERLINILDLFTGVSSSYLEATPIPGSYEEFRTAEYARNRKTSLFKIVGIALVVFALYAKFNPLFVTGGIAFSLMVILGNKSLLSNKKFFLDNFPQNASKIRLLQRAVDENRKEEISHFSREISKKDVADQDKEGAIDVLLEEPKGKHIISAISVANSITDQTTKETALRKIVSYGIRNKYNNFFYAFEERKKEEFWIKLYTSNENDRKIMQNIENYKQEFSFSALEKLGYLYIGKMNTGDKEEKLAYSVHACRIIKFIQGLLRDQEIGIHPGRASKQKMLDVLGQLSTKFAQATFPEDNLSAYNLLAKLIGQKAEIRRKCVVSSFGSYADISIPTWDKPSFFDQLSEQTKRFLSVTNLSEVRSFYAEKKTTDGAKSFLLDLHLECEQEIESVSNPGEERNLCMKRLKAIHEAGMNLVEETIFY